MLRLRFVVNQQKPATKESMNAILKSTGLTALLVAVALLAGCASERTETNLVYKERQYAANPSKVKFGEFKYVELKQTELNPQENNEGNQKSAKRIDQMLLGGLKDIWPDLKVIPAGGEFSKSGDRTLQISPRIKHIHIVGPGGRFWLGVAAGDSDLVMHVDYRDSSTGELIAWPDFWKGSSAWAGGWSGGATDNQIRDVIVYSIVNYTQGNK
jgi:hypothetical protein